VPAPVAAECFRAHQRFVFGSKTARCASSGFDIAGSSIPCWRRTATCPASAAPVFWRRLGNSSRPFTPSKADLPPAKRTRKPIFINISSPITYKNSGQKSALLCRKTAIPAEKNAAFANDFSNSHDLSIRKLFCQRHFRRAAIIEKYHAQKPTVGFRPFAVSVTIPA
jgi:hypothetical protein